MTMQHFIQGLSAMAFVGSAALWLAAFNLAGRAGRLVLTAGLYLIFEPRIGRHEMRGRPVYEDEPVHLRENRTEEQRIEAYQLMVAETQMMPVTTSAAPYTVWAAALHPTDLDELRASLDAVVRDFQRDLTLKMDAVLADFLRERTEEHALVGA